MIWARNPVVHEVFTWVWLHDLADALGHPVTLANVPPGAWDDLAAPGVDAVWLMGVWTRSPYGAAIAQLRGQRDGLAGFTDDDVVGSAYCVRDYRVDPRLGGDDALARARDELASRGVRLVLDFVPNHLAPDHAWVTEHPDRFIAGNRSDLLRDPASFIDIGGRVIACGRDPSFPAWTDVVQLDCSLPEVRAAAADVVAGIADRCDGVRCDMAMLMLDDVFTKTWGSRARGGPAPDGGRGYWPTVIDAVRADHPHFVFWAEAYWDREPDLVAQGFDACYDKRLYDHIVHGAAASTIRAHLGGDVRYQEHTMRFVENHDELRAASILDTAAHEAAAVAVFTLPGVALLYEGESDGRRVRVPVTLRRRPQEDPDDALRAFFGHLLAALAPGMRRGQWSLATVSGWPDNQSCDRLAAWTWTGPDQRHVVAVNFSDQRADGRVQLPWPDLAGRAVVFEDLLSMVCYERDGTEISRDGLYVGLDHHGAHVMRVSAP